MMLVEENTVFYYSTALADWGGVYICRLEATYFSSRNCCVINYAFFLNTYFFYSADCDSSNILNMDSILFSAIRTSYILFSLPIVLLLSTFSFDSSIMAAKLLLRVASRFCSVYSVWLVWVVWVVYFMRLLYKPSMILYWLFIYDLYSLFYYNLIFNCSFISMLGFFFTSTVLLND